MSIENQSGVLQKQILHAKKHWRNFLPHENADSNFQSAVLSILESLIIPRLLEAEKIRTRHLSLSFSSSTLPSQKEIEKFADICISQDKKCTQTFVNHFLEIGLSKEDIFLKLISPTARYLGSKWDDASIDFPQVNQGLVRLHDIANEFKLVYKEGVIGKSKVKRIMLASAPGSLQMIGTTFVADFFHKQDWQVAVSIPSSADELIQAVSQQWFDVIGLSISMVQQLDTLADLINQFKCSSLNPCLAVLLDGNIFAVKEFRAIDFCADDICVNAKHAVSLAESLLPRV